MEPLDRDVPITMIILHEVQKEKLPQVLHTWNKMAHTVMLHEVGTTHFEMFVISNETSLSYEQYANREALHAHQVAACALPTQHPTTFTGRGIHYGKRPIRSERKLILRLTVTQEIAMVGSLEKTIHVHVYSYCTH